MWWKGNYNCTLNLFIVVYALGQEIYEYKMNKTVPSILWSNEFRTHKKDFFEGIESCSCSSGQLIFITSLHWRKWVQTCIIFTENETVISYKLSFWDKSFLKSESKKVRFSSAKRPQSASNEIRQVAKIVIECQLHHIASKRDQEEQVMWAMHTYVVFLLIDDLVLWQQKNSLCNGYHEGGWRRGKKFQPGLYKDFLSRKVETIGSFFFGELKARKSRLVSTTCLLLYLQLSADCSFYLEYVLQFFEDPWILLWPSLAPSQAFLPIRCRYFFKHSFPSFIVVQTLHAVDSFLDQKSFSQNILHNGRWQLKCGFGERGAILWNSKNKMVIKRILSLHAAKCRDY